MAEAGKSPEKPSLLSGQPQDNLLYLTTSRSGFGLSNLSIKLAAVGIFTAGWIYSTSVDLRGLLGWTLTWLLDFQNERLVSYFMLFLPGTLCGSQGIFDRKPGSKRLYTVINATSRIPILLYLVFLISLWLNPNEVIVS